MFKLSVNLNKDTISCKNRDTVQSQSWPKYFLTSQQATTRQRIRAPVKRYSVQNVRPSEL